MGALIRGVTFVMLAFYVGYIIAECWTWFVVPLGVIKISGVHGAGLFVLAQFTRLPETAEKLIAEANESKGFDFNDVLKAHMIATGSNVLIFALLYGVAFLIQDAM
jgi:hypothetical protein